VRPQARGGSREIGPSADDERRRNVTPQARGGSREIGPSADDERRRNVSTFFSRVAVVGDIHAEHERLERALDFAAKAKVDAVLYVGDVVDGDGDLERCVALLEERDAIGVAGNHERWLFEGTLRSLPGYHRLANLSERARTLLGRLPKTETFETPSGRLLLCHGMGHDDMHGILPDSSPYDVDNHDELQRLLRERTVSFVACGHTHRRMVRVVGELTIMNAGALPQEDAPTLLVADFEAGVVELYDVVGEVRLATSLAMRVPAPRP
jgi:predicted phosphodiesterase